MNLHCMHGGVALIAAAICGCVTTKHKEKGDRKCKKTNSVWIKTPDRLNIRWARPTCFAMMCDSQTNEQKSGVEKHCQIFCKHFSSNTPSAASKIC